MNGNELTRHLRDHPETGKAVVIAITGYGHDIDKKLTLASGFDHHLVKPVDTKKLLQSLPESASHENFRWDCS